jgi:hypothetical protein
MVGDHEQGETRERELYGLREGDAEGQGGEL